MDKYEQIYCWRMASNYCGQHSAGEHNCEEHYFASYNLRVRIYLVSPDWIKIASLPLDFLKNPTNFVVGCVRTTCYNRSNQIVPMVVYDMRKIACDNEISLSGDPLLNIIEGYFSRDDNPRVLVIAQSSANPWHIGTLSHSDGLDVRLLPWSLEENLSIYGLESAAEEN